MSDGGRQVWADVLHELRRSVDVARAMAGDDVLPGPGADAAAAPAPWSPPDPGALPAMPADLRAEAVALAADLAAATAAVSARRGVVAGELNGAPRARPAVGRGAPQLVDHRL